PALARGRHGVRAVMPGGRGPRGGGRTGGGGQQARTHGDPGETHAPQFPRKTARTPPSGTPVNLGEWPAGDRRPRPGCFAPTELASSKVEGLPSDRYATAAAGAAMGKLDLGPVGVALTVSGTYLGRAAELERLGYSTLWLPGGQIDGLGRLAEVIRATAAVPV